MLYGSVLPQKSRMMNNPFKKPETYTISIKSFLDAAFTDNRIPNNAFIDKGRTGIGGTTMELEALRPSIIVMNRVTAIIEKGKKMNTDAGCMVVLPVYEDHNSKDYIKAYLQSDVPDKKILVTPESFDKVMAAAEELGMTKEITETYFLLVDEQHSFIIESYRENILKVFDYFWNFKNKALISATPIIPSDPRFQELDYHNIMFHERTLNTVTLVDSKSPTATLRYIISNREYSDCNLHIFYNSVTGIAETVNAMGLSDCNIFCAENERNKDKLGEAERFFNANLPSKDEKYKKVNFYTSKYLESWDMEDKEKTVFVMVTDIHHKHTLLTVREQLVQCIGRLRNTEQLQQIIHVTNHRSVANIEEYDKIHGHFSHLFQNVIKGVNAFLELGMAQTDFIKRFVGSFAVWINGGRYRFDPNKCDQVIHGLYSNQIYNHIRYIEREWRNTLYEPIPVSHEINVGDLNRVNITNGRTAKARFEQRIAKIHAAKQDFDKDMFHFGTTEWEKYQELYPDECRIYETLGIDNIRVLGYSQSNIKKAMILASAAQTEEKLMMLVNDAFSVSQFYSNIEIKAVLQRLYDELDIKDVGRNQRLIKRTATATHIRNWFEVSQTSRKNAAGKNESGFIITGKKPMLTLMENQL